MSYYLEVFQETAKRAQTPKGRQIPLFKVFLPYSVEKPLLATLFSGYIGQGKRVDEFESKFGSLVGNENVLALNSGTSALHLAYHMCTERLGDKIITTPMTCAATNVPIVNTKQSDIIWADIDPLTGLIDPEDVKNKITKRTKAIVMVHWGGNSCSIDAINAIAKKYNIRTIEDASHSLGSLYKGRLLGNNTSDFVVYSLQAIKHITTIDGGVLVCRRSEDYKRGKLLRWYGIDRDEKSEDFRCERDIQEAGYKFHMNDVSASIGIEQLKYLKFIVEKHRENANYYNENLTVDYVKENPDGKSAYWLYTVLLPSRKRDAFIRYMLRKGVQVSKVHVRNDTHSAFRKYKQSLPGVNEFDARHCCIPVGWWLTGKQREKIAQYVNAFM